MIQWVSLDLEYIEHDFVRSARNKLYAKIWFKDKQTKRRVAIYDFSGLDSAAGVIAAKGKSRWWMSGVVNTVGEKHFLVLQRFAILEGGKKINPYSMREGFASVELVS